MCYNPKTFYFTRERVNTFHTFVQARFEELTHSTGKYIESRQVDCGKCEECLEKKRLNWTKRLVADLFSLKSKFYFLTLTYDAAHVPVIPVGKKFQKYQTKKQTYNIYTQHLSDVCETVTLGSNNEYISHKLKHGVFVPPQPRNKKWQYNEAKLRYECRYEDFEPVSDSFLMVHSKYDVDLFLKRFRINMKRMGLDLTDKLRYALVSEYGCAGERPHYHAIIYGFPHHYPDMAIRDCLRASWNNGFIKLDKPKVSAIRYVTKYMYTKSVVPKGCPQNFRLFSSGIGSDFDPARITCDVDLTQMFVPMGKRGVFKFVSIPLQCLSYYYKKQVNCPVYEAYKRKVNDVGLCVRSFGSCGIHKDGHAVRVLPKYCTSMLHALCSSRLVSLSPSYLYSTIDQHEHKIEDFRIRQLDIRHALESFQTGKSVPSESCRVRKARQIKAVKMLMDKCSESLRKPLRNRLREVLYRFEKLELTYTYDRYWKYFLRCDEWTQRHVVRPSAYSLANVCPF